MFKKLCVVMVMALIFVVPISAKIYEVSDEMLEEIKSNYEIFKAEPDSLDARFNLAMSFAYSGLIERGWNMIKDMPPTYSVVVIEKYEPLVEAEPQEWRHAFKLAFGYSFAEKNDDAKAQFLRVLEIEGEHVWSMGFLALLEGLDKNYEAGITWCQKALKIEPNATAIHLLLAEGYRQTGNYFGMMGSLMKFGQLKTKEKVRNLKLDDEL